MNKLVLSIATFFLFVLSANATELITVSSQADFQKYWAINQKAMAKSMPVDITEIFENAEVVKMEFIVDKTGRPRDFRLLPDNSENVVKNEKTIKAFYMFLRYRPISDKTQSVKFSGSVVWRKPS
ncbi:hypothetical protein ISG33_12320 [Glaciecola sp. MH2013]|uniref:hypothetical protein n=1 Tax=Glaciecola sp. MH2013 TaxID=2785524 RepID=UPI00189F0E3E|nr:hypothetical protein [Glaciecola sp. MH2013]MBF7074186.1 hypothetical protein [Glaciecola sp. MH2013]